MRTNRNTIITPAIGLFAALAVASSGVSIAAPATTDAFVAHQRQTGRTCRVIVKLDGPLTGAESAALRAAGGDIYRDLPIIGSVALTIPSNRLDRLAQMPFVRHISSDVTARKTDEFTMQDSGTAAAYSATGLTGNGVTVAVLDSGIHPSNDLNTQGLLLTSSRVIASANFVPTTDTASTSLSLAVSLGSLSLTTNLTNSASPTDDTCGHGTHVAGILAGNGASSSGLTCYRTFYGIARRANLVNARVLDGNGVGDVSNVIAGIQWIVSNRAKYNIRVLNCSLGHSAGESYTTDPLCQAMEAAWKAGIVVVCAAGNDGRANATAQPGFDNQGYGTNYGSIVSPGNDPYVITVGAMKKVDSLRADDAVATYSSRGPSRLDLVLKPDIMAPGNRVISVEAKGSSLQQNCGATNQVPYGSYESLTLTPSSSSDNYFILSGTSMAAPVVAGAAALMLEASPSLTPDTIKARLMVSADKWLCHDGTSDPLTYGAGYVNVQSALKSTLVATVPALSPTLFIGSDGLVHLNWNGSVLANHAIWGTTVTDDHAIWGTSGVWSNDTITSTHAIWGTTAVQSDHAIWGTSGTSVDLSATAVNGE